MRGVIFKAICKLKRNGCWYDTDSVEAEIAGGRDLDTSVFAMPQDNTPLLFLLKSSLRLGTQTKNVAKQLQS